MSDKFSKLPTELQLYILHFVDSQTLRQCVSLINKNFYDLSKDCTLYQEYQIAEFDVECDKLRVELDNDLYRSNLKSLSITIDCLNGEILDGPGLDYSLDLEQFRKLDKLTVTSDSRTRFDLEKIPLSSGIKTIQVHGKLSTTPFAHLQSLIPLLEKVSTVCIDDEGDLKKKLEIPAELYLIEANLFSSDKFLNRFLKEDLSDFQKQKSFGIEISYSTDLTARSRVLNHVAGNIVEICAIIDSDDRGAVAVICRDCSALKFLSLWLRRIKDFVEIREVGCQQLQTLVLEGYEVRGKRGINKVASNGEFLLMLRLLIGAAQHGLQLEGFSGIPSVVLSWLSESLESLKMSDCTILDEFTHAEDRSSIKSLLLDRVYNINEEDLRRLLNPDMTRLNLNINLQKRQICPLLGGLRMLEEFVIIDTATGPVDLRQVLESLLPARNTLRVFKCWSPTPAGDRRDILKLLRRFRHIQYVELAGPGRKKDIVEFFPSAIVRKRHRGIKIFI